MVEALKEALSNNNKLVLKDLLPGKFNFFECNEFNDKITNEYKINNVNFRPLDLMYPHNKRVRMTLHENKTLEIKLID